MRRDAAPMYHAHRHGGVKEKACIGHAPRKDANAGRGGRCCTAFAPVAQMERALVRTRMVVSSSLAGGALVQWVLECANTQEPATVTRIRGTVAPLKAI